MIIILFRLGWYPFIPDIQGLPVCDVTSFCRMKMSIMTKNPSRIKDFERQETQQTYTAHVQYYIKQKDSFRIKEKINGCVT